MVSAKEQSGTAYDTSGCSGNQIQENGRYIDYTVAGILFWTGDLYGNCKNGRERNCSDGYGAYAAGIVLCIGWDSAVSLYAGVSGGQMGYREKYPAGTACDDGNSGRMLCESGNCRIISEDDLRYQKRIDT